MRVSLSPDVTELARQVSQLRAFLNAQDKKGGQAAVSARLQTACFLPLLATLRSELRDGVVPEQVMTAGADLLGNIAVTIVQVEAPPEAEAEMVAQLLEQAGITATQAIHQSVEAAKLNDNNGKPKLSVVRPEAEQATVFHMPKGMNGK